MTSLGSGTAEAMGLAVSRFHQRLLLGFGAVILVGSVMEDDHRGLLFWDAPEALAASVPLYDGAVINALGGDSAYLTNLALGAASPRQRQLRRIRNIPGRFRPADAAFVGTGGGGDAPGSPVQLAAADPVAELVPVPAVTPPTGSSSGPPISPGSGFSPSPIGASQLVPVVIDPAVPLVPAIPEPSSWVLMILGIGLLGEVLRRSRGQVSHMGLKAARA